jgi:hypothetical protein
MTPETAWPLRHPVVIETLVLNDVPVVVRLAVLPSLGASQKHDAANPSAPSRAWESGRSSLQPFWPKTKTSLVANQLLSRLKNLKIRVFEGESAKTG